MPPSYMERLRAQRAGVAHATVGGVGDAVILRALRTFASRRWFRRVGDDAASSVIIRSPLPIPNKTRSTRFS